jgi:hypothetical protein
LAVGAGFASAAAAVPPLGVRDLEEAAARAREDPSAVASLVGRRFALDVAPREVGPKHRLCDGFPFWGFYPSEAAYYAGLSEEWIYPADFRDGRGGRSVRRFRSGETLHFVSVACRHERLPARTALNHAGEARALEPTRQEIVAIAHRSRDLAASHYWKTPADAAAGAALGRGIVVRITGTVGAWEPGRPIACGRAAGMMREALDAKLHACLVNGRVDRVEYVDAVTGAVRAAGRLRDEPWRPADGQEPDGE